MSTNPPSPGSKSSKSKDKGKGKGKSSSITPRVTVTRDVDFNNGSSAAPNSAQKSRKRRPRFGRDQVITIESVPEDGSEPENIESAAELRRRQVAEYRTQWNDIHKVLRGSWTMKRRRSRCRPRIITIPLPTSPRCEFISKFLTC